MAVDANYLGCTDLWRDPDAHEFHRHYGEWNLIERKTTNRCNPTGTDPLQASNYSHRRHLHGAGESKSAGVAALFD